MTRLALLLLADVEEAGGALVSQRTQTEKNDEER